jgi:large subunit ribosomal protein L9
MKVVLLQDIPKVGKKYEVKDVADGFGRNVLLKSGKVKLATPQTLNEIELIKKNQVAFQMKSAEEFQRLVQILKESKVTLKARASKEGALFASIHKKEICEAVKKQLGLSVEEEMMVLDKPIKHTGDFSLKITNGEPGARHLEANLNLIILPE